MVDTGTAIIAGSVISLFGGIIMMQVWQNGWFKRERFRLQIQQTKAIDRINIKKMEKDLGLRKGRSASAEITPNSQSGLLQYLPALVETAKENPDILGTLADKLLSNPGGESSPDLLNGIAGFVKDNPEILEGIMDGFQQNKADQAGEIVR